MGKRCGRCGEDKSTEQFHRWKRGDGLQPWCKACRSTYDSDYSRRTLARRRERRRERRLEFVPWYQALKESKPCTDCGQRFPAVAMHWDHLPEFTKGGDVGHLQRSMSKRRVLEEIAKCELVCANCHAIRTMQRRDPGV